MNPGSPEPVPPLVPVVRYMVVSNDLQNDPASPHLIDIIGLLYSIRALDDPPFPLLYPQLCVFLALTDSRGEGEGWLECVNADTGQRIFRSARHPIVFGDDPLRVVGAKFRVADCPFPAAGMYAIQFWYNGTLVEQKYLRVGASHGSRTGGERRVPHAPGMLRAGHSRAGYDPAGREDGPRRERRDARARRSSR